MRTRPLVTVLALAGALGLSACDKKEDASADAKSQAQAHTKKDEQDEKKADAKLDVKADAPKADEAKADGGGAATVVELPKLGLKAEAPAETSVGDTALGGGVMVQGPDLIVTVDVASEDRPKASEEATKSADGYTPNNVETEALEDGWAVTFDNEGDLGPNYFVWVRRELGGKSYWCETTASSPEQQANALAFCKSLKQ